MINIFELNVQEWLFIGILILSFIIILLTYIKFYWPAVQHQNINKALDVPVSVIICARNEEENLRNHLPYILEQNYSHFEVIIVNDCSIDATEEVIDQFIQKYPDKIKKVNIPESENYKHGKKMAIFIGIKHAKYEHLLFTDADCKPSSNLWIKEMIAQFSNDKQIVLGYGKYEAHPGLLNQLIRYDTLVIALQYFSFAIHKNPYMGVGRNLAYTKSLFFNNKGFANHYHLISGDDDLFVNETATSANTAICTDSKAFTISEPAKKFKHWVLQKSRHLTTAPLYKPKHRIALGWIYFSFILYYLSHLAVLCIFPHLYLFVISSFILKYIIQWVILSKAAKKFQEPKLAGMSFFLEILLIIAYIYIALYKKIKKL